MSPPLLSVIVPVHNGSKTIHDCLGSIFSASYAHFECIVVDDHSSDDTVDIAQKFNTRIVRIDSQKGAAYARNRGAEAAGGDVLIFVDSDVVLYPNSLELVSVTFEENPDVSALFGSYDDKPACQNFVSQYKNLFHHYIHQTGQKNASTFWTGFGAVRKDVFFEVGKFDEQCRMMEDIELGYKLKARNHRVLLVRELMVKHLKRFAFKDLVKSDLFDRAIPWTILMLRNKQFTGDLNLKGTYKLSALAVVLLLACVFLASQSGWFILPIAALLCVYVLLNYEFYKFFAKKKGLRFALKVVPLHILYYLYSMLGFFLGSVKYFLVKWLTPIS